MVTFTELLRNFRIHDTTRSNHEVCRNRSKPSQPAQDGQGDQKSDWAGPTPQRTQASRVVTEGTRQDARATHSYPK